MASTALKTQAALATALGVSQQRVSVLLKRADWRWGRGPWNSRQVSAIRQHLEAMRSESSASAGTGGGQSVTQYNLGDLVDPPTLLKLVPNPEKRIKLAATIERLKRQEFDREREMGLYLRKDQVEAGWLARVQAIRGALATAKQLAPRIVGLSLAEIEVELEKWARGLCLKFEREA